MAYACIEVADMIMPLKPNLPSWYAPYAKFPTKTYEA